jgi:hypothetical protein
MMDKCCLNVGWKGNTPKLNKVTVNDNKRNYNVVFNKTLNEKERH